MVITFCVDLTDGLLVPLSRSVTSTDTCSKSNKLSMPVKVSVSPELVDQSVKLELLLA